MPQSLVNNLIHLIYSPQNRRPLITGEIREDLNASNGMRRNMMSNTCGIEQYGYSSTLSGLLFTLVLMTQG